MSQDQEEFPTESMTTEIDAAHELGVGEPGESAPAPAEPAPTTLLGRINSGITPWVFYPSALIIVGFVAFAMALPDTAGDFFQGVNDNIVGALGWYYILAVAIFVAFSFYMGLSRFGRIRLGKESDRPEFSTVSWFSMLFAAGMGIGLVFWGVAEPLNHFANPRPAVAGLPTADVAEQAINQSYMHWGIHAWAIYAVVGAAIAYTVHRLGKPMSIRWSLQPVLGNRVKGGLGHAIDVAAVVGTLFGVATSLGLGVSQIASGMDAVDLLTDPGNLAKVIIIGIITMISLASLLSGVGKGIKWLSNANLVLAGGLLLFVLIAGPSLFLAREFVQSIGTYIQDFIGLTFDVSAYEGQAGEDWQAGWTTFYWGWWIAWAPFVGIFIARISKGRTVGEFVAGVLAVPTIITFMWFSIMGGTALYREMNGPGGLIGEDGSVDSTMSLFSMLADLPGGYLISIGAIILIALFFITSSDSGSLVVSMLTADGTDDPPRWVRVFWGVTEGLVAAALLVAGGLGALQTASIIAALPFSIVMLLMVVSLWKMFHKEHLRYEFADRQELLSEIGDHYGLEEPQPDPPPVAKRRRLPQFPVRKKGAKGAPASQGAGTATATAAADEPVQEGTVEDR
ncbi:BCCT family transporter [Demequina zhanjiangensis]|uniref:BCCT family transporter n=1 Tax=Demequina zhanjiangensis TaxID=3051659 RepID=A0ABT8G430_9MICO|nr:BCCT family transporter [Demequina sp. SYSU T00b26]MDN4473896.1 BCCT family transporter [Demequina sp. SYSU T00b26]